MNKRKHNENQDNQEEYKKLKVMYSNLDKKLSDTQKKLKELQDEKNDIIRENANLKKTIISEVEKYDNLIKNKDQIKSKLDLLNNGINHLSDYYNQLYILEKNYKKINSMENEELDKIYIGKIKNTRKKLSNIINEVKVEFKL